MFVWEEMKSIAGIKGKSNPGEENMPPSKERKMPVNRRSSTAKIPKITYATLGMPNPRVHDEFDRALDRVKARLGKTHPMIIEGAFVMAGETFEDTSPIHTDWLLGKFQKGTVRQAREAVVAARKAFRMWSGKPWMDRVKILRRAAGLMEKRIYELSALTSLEVGKNRLEAIGDIQESIDLIYFYGHQMELNRGYSRGLARESAHISNRSVLRPHGVWVVISPFNFPSALAAGPGSAAMMAGNTVVLKPATDTPYTALEVVRCFLDAGLPDGVLNFVTGPGSTLGNALIEDPEVDGITFTGSYEVGMRIFRTFAAGRYPRPCIAEMGGKNPAIVSRKADLDLAAMGVMRSAFGLQGQKCSACSRVYIENPVREPFIEKLLKLTQAIVIGNPLKREVWLGPVINKKAYDDFKTFCKELREAGRILHGGEYLTEGDFGKGFFCAPTIVDGLPLDHPLWKKEMFLPIVTVAGVENLGEAMRQANAGDYGLTAGFFSSSPKEIEWFLANIQAGVTYVNRQAGATTGAWPGYQAFGGWKGSGSTGKAGGSLHYLPQFMREQSRTVVC
jgi:1-pyrroline-5-carboxylate dehydrogenase